MHAHKQLYVYISRHTTVLTPVPSVSGGKRQVIELLNPIYFYSSVYFVFWFVCVHPHVCTFSHVDICAYVKKCHHNAKYLLPVEKLLEDFILSS